MARRVTFALAALVALAPTLVPATAEAWRARNHHQVNPVSPTVFEVIGRPGSGAADYWCGAGDYVRHALRMPAVQRVYIWRQIGQSVTNPGRKSVQFSLNPPKERVEAPKYSLSVKAVGDNLTAAFAFQYCLDDDRFDRFPRWP